jgi:type I restriction enzyme M protein
MSSITFLNPRTCGIYKSGGIRYKTDPKTGKRTDEIDNELIDAVEAYVRGKETSGTILVAEESVFAKGVIVPTYYDERFNKPIEELLLNLNTEGVTIGELIDNKTLSVRGGHGSPGNDQRAGNIPYIKVSDIRAMRMNINPTNLVSGKVAERFWKGKSSKIHAWDVLTPNRASNNIGEFAIVLPGEERVVLTKEMFIFRVEKTDTWTPFYLFWALCLSAVRDQWRRIALMQTNREDCGQRHREIIIPRPKSKEWALKMALAYKRYFETLAAAREDFMNSLEKSELKYIPSALGAADEALENEEEPEIG